MIVCLSKSDFNQTKSNKWQNDSKKHGPSQVFIVVTEIELKIIGCSSRFNPKNNNITANKFILVMEETE